VRQKIIVLGGEHHNVEDHRQVWSNYAFFVVGWIFFFQSWEFFNYSVQNSWVFVQKVSLTAYLWQLLDQLDDSLINLCVLPEHTNWFFCVFTHFGGSWFELKQKQKVVSFFYQKLWSCSVHKPNLPLFWHRLLSLLDVIYYIL